MIKIYHLEIPSGDLSKPKSIIVAYSTWNPVWQFPFIQTKYEVPSGDLQIAKYEIPSGDLQIAKYEIPSGDLLSQLGIPSGDSFLFHEKRGPIWRPLNNET